VALQGQVVETGVAFVITLDYNEFKELFQKVKTTKINREPYKQQSDEFHTISSFILLFI
jgi:hypothetical protein